MILKMIYEEEGEPISPVYKEEEGYSVLIEDHETGEQHSILIPETMKTYEELMDELTVTKTLPKY